jgi:hypothetical protein
LIWFCAPYGNSLSYNEKWRKMSASKIVVVIALAAAVGGWVFQVHRNCKLDDEVRALRQDQGSLLERFSALEAEHEKMRRELASREGSPQLVNVPPIQSKSPPQAQPQAVAALAAGELEQQIDRACAETSPGQREAALEQISRSISRSDIPRALAYLATRQGMDGPENPLFKQLSSKWAENDPNAALNWVNSLSDPATQKEALLGVLTGWSHVSPKDAAAYASQLPPGNLQEDAVLKVVNEWSFRDPAAAASWVSKFPEGNLRDKAAGPVIFWGQGQCPATIADMLDTMGNAELKKEHFETVAVVWMNRDPAAAKIWIQRSSVSEEAKQRVLAHAGK